MNGIEWALAHGMRVSVAQLPEGDDPDSFVRREGGPALERLIEMARPLAAFRRAYFRAHPERTDLDAGRGFGGVEL